MKRFALISLFAAVLFSLAFTWEGELNPNELETWLVVKGSATLTQSGLYQLTLKNPDQTAAIKKVQVYINPSNSNLLAYRYFKGGEIYIYYLDQTKDKYVRYKLPLEKRFGCMKCHGDQLNDKRES